MQLRSGVQVAGAIRGFDSLGINPASFFHAPELLQSLAGMIIGGDIARIEAEQLLEFGDRLLRLIKFQIFLRQAVAHKRIIGIGGNKVAERFEA